MDESTRQTITALFVAIGNAAGPDVLQRACRSIDMALAYGSIPSFVAQSTLRQLTGSIHESRGLDQEEEA
jgi:hypothetical protein